MQEGCIDYAYGTLTQQFILEKLQESISQIAQDNITYPFINFFRSFVMESTK